MHLLLLKDTDIDSPKPILHILKKEIHAIKKAMELIGANHLVLSHFDAHGGDCGCQFRASILAELISHLTPSSFSYFESRLKEAERIEAQIEQLSKKPELFFHYPKQAMKKEHHHQKITLTHVLKFYSCTFTSRSENDNHWEDFCYLCIACYLSTCKDKNGLKCIFDKDKPLVKFLQNYITRKSVEHVEKLAQQSLREITFHDDIGRAVVPIRIAFDHLWQFWINNFTMFFRITRFHDKSISFHYVTIHHHQKGNQSLLNDLDQNKPCIFVDCISSNLSLSRVHSIRKGDTCLGFDISTVDHTTDSTFDELLQTLSIEEFKVMLDCFFASHPQMINKSFSIAHEEMVENALPGFIHQIQRETELADCYGCSKENVKFFAPEHIYCETINGITRRFGL